MQELFEKYLDDHCSSEQLREFLGCFNYPDNELELRRLISETLEENNSENDGNEWMREIDESFAVIKRHMIVERNEAYLLTQETLCGLASTQQ
jgi:hypothetical protein